MVVNINGSNCYPMFCCIESSIISLISGSNLYNLKFTVSAGIDDTPIETYHNISPKASSRNNLNKLSFAKCFRAPKLLPCRQCDQQFRYNSELMQHQENYTGRGSLICENCGSDFKRESSLQKHKQKKHGEENPKDYQLACS